VTKVEEWTNAEIGVGAAIAAGNQGENGKIALLVIKATVSNAEEQLKIPKSIKTEVLKFMYMTETIEIIKKQSPRRLIKTVNNPEKIEDSFW